MTETPTISDRRGLAQAAVEAASTKLAELADERASLGLAAFEGDKEAIARLSAIDEEISEAERRRRLAEDALAEIETLSQEAEVAADQEKRRELSEEFDQLVTERVKALKRFEKALDSLEGAIDAVLEVDERQRSLGLDLGLIDGAFASYSLTIKDRVLTRFSGLLGAGPTVPHFASLTEDAGVFTQTIAESEDRKERGLKQAQESGAEEERVRAAVARREKIQYRRDALLAQGGYATAAPFQKAEIEARVEEWLAEEFPPEAPETVTDDRRAS
jgi:hypothetical protein